MIEIKNRYNGSVISSIAGESLVGVDLSFLNFTDAILTNVKGLTPWPR